MNMVWDVPVLPDRTTENGRKWVTGRIESDLTRRMLSGAAGPLLSFSVLLLVPITSAFLLTSDEFAMWAILNTVVTVATTFDFGGATLVAMRYRSAVTRTQLVLKGLPIRQWGRR